MRSMAWGREAVCAMNVCMSTLDPMQQELQQMTREAWSQSLIAWPSQRESCSPTTSGLMLVLAMEQWELYNTSATALEDHQTCPLLSWSTLTEILALLFITTLCPSLLCASPISLCSAVWRRSAARRLERRSSLSSALSRARRSLMTPATRSLWLSRVTDSSHAQESRIGVRI